MKTIIEVMQDILEQQDIYKNATIVANTKKKYAYGNYANGKMQGFKEAFIILEYYCLENKIELPNPFPKKQSHEPNSHF